MSCMFFSRCYTAHDRKLAAIFGRYGRFISKHPWLIILFSILLNLIGGIGILKFEYETNIETQYYLDKSRAFQDRDFIRRTFPQNEYNFQPHALSDLGYFGEVIIRTKNKGNIYQESVFQEVLSIHRKIKNGVAVKYLNRSFTFTDVCAKSFSKCVIQGEEVLSPDFVTDIRRMNVTYPRFKNLLLSSTIAKATLNGSVLVAAQMIKLRYFLTQVPEEKSQISKLWVKEFIKHMENITTKELEVAFLYHNAMDDEVMKSGLAEAHLFPLTLIIMIVYASIATSGRKIDCVYDVQNLGRIGVFAALISMIPAIGIASACGVKFMNSVATMPFLIIGIGINDMFIILSGYAETVGDHVMSLEKRIERTMMTSGLSITITSLTDIITFLIGYSSIYTTIQNFCVFTGIAVFFCYFNQLTILTPCLVLHQRRVDQNQHSYTCKPTRPRDQLKKEGRSCCYVTFCSGNKPLSRTDMESILEIYPKRLVQFIVSNNISRLIVFCLYIVYLVFAIIGATGLRQSTKYSDLALVGSNYYKANIWDYENYPLELPFQIVFQKPLHYEDSFTRTAINKMVQNLKNDTLVRDDVEINWLTSFERFYGNSITPDNFYQLANEFISATKMFKEDVVFSSDNRSIIYSRVYLLSDNVRTSEQQAELLINVRQIVDSSGLPCTVYTPLFMFCEQYVNMISSALQTVGTAVSAMFLITCFFMPHPLVIFIVTTSMVSILTGVFGFIKLWGLDISVVTMIELVISVGFSVDFSAHICHAYLTSPSHDRASRVREAIELAGGPIINGACSTIIGLSLLSSSNSFIFQSFFKVLFFVVVFGLLHGVIIIPIVFTYIGPKVRILSKGETTPDEKEDSQEPLVVPHTNGYIQEPQPNDTKYNGSIM